MKFTWSIFVKFIYLRESQGGETWKGGERDRVLSQLHTERGTLHWAWSRDPEITIPSSNQELDLQPTVPPSHPHLKYFSIPCLWKLCGPVWGSQKYRVIILKRWWTLEPFCRKTSPLCGHICTKAKHFAGASGKGNSDNFLGARDG